MRLYDISVGISADLPVWPGDPSVEIERIGNIKDGEESNVSRMGASVHIGTHVDAPLHFFEGGASIESLPLEVLIGRAYVVDLPDAKVIDAKTLEDAKIPPRTRRLLFKTSNSSFWANGEKQFQEDYVGVDRSGAEWLVRKGIQLVGIDYLSIAMFDDPAEPHRILLEAGMVILEGVNLSEIQRGRYTLYCFPIKIIGSDGAPARAILAGV
jgi:arylformamidase